MQIGDRAPEVLGLDENGQEVRLSQFSGQKIILYFYPKDNTSGCTAEACSFRDSYTDLQQKGFAVVGASVDSAASHQKFKAKHGLPFPLIADVNHELVEAMGVWAEKSMYGRKYMGIVRTTFIIGEDGTVERIIPPKEIKTKIHGQQIVESV